MIKQFVPRAIKETLKDTQRRLAFDVAMRRFRGRSISDIHSDESLLQSLVDSWGNPDWSANVAFLRASLREVDCATSAILECGTGLTTVLMAALASRKAPIYSLEHQSAWHKYVGAHIDKHDAQDVSVIMAEIRDYGEYAWYDVAQLDVAPGSIDLVICDGPPGDTPGGRYGLLAQAGHLMTPSCRILLDDYHREHERQIVDRWAREFGYRVLTIAENGEFVVLSAKSVSQ